MEEATVLDFSGPSVENGTVEARTSWYDDEILNV